MDRRFNELLANWGRVQNPVLVYTPDPKEIEDWEKSLPYKLEDVFDFTAGLGEKEVAAREGDLSTVQRIFDQLRGTPFGDYWISHSASIVFNAVRNRQRASTKYLLNQGSYPSDFLAKIAADNNDQALLELFLRHGWDINEQLKWSTPPTFEIKSYF
ncbi:hypothetical protein Z517_05377 [Fonsecaea pedrosoi CBS 271.37]|uniref:Uncharacterized protein n=1 Tax=Fonsecaea pedrosoi CBS 271.37 TaxID=1442368 RepID=A0A0D2GUQ1_9EURO|nr:uncharacterized protein Z517_05377 [Fonsecaea pedrosoi CBS 271.37]KIW82350.1 hypothetical protein Z517_05377 [Fonsecaea pedrosoi CBS 271.37]